MYGLVAKFLGGYQKRRLVYLACPYSDESGRVRAERVAGSVRAMKWLVERGCVVFNPLSHSDGVGDFGEEVWYALDLRVLEGCDHLLVLMLDGWDESFGVALEIEFALERGMGVDFLDPADIGEGIEGPAELARSLAEVGYVRRIFRGGNEFGV